MLRLLKFLRGINTLTYLLRPSIPSCYREGMKQSVKDLQPYLLGELSRGAQEASWFKALKLLKDSRSPISGIAAGAIEPAWANGSLRAVADQTTALMQLGVPWIRNGVLMGDQLLGVPDLLRKVDDPLEGSPQYKPYVVRCKAEPTDADVLELTAYGLLLGELQGTVPAQGGVYLQNGETLYLDLPSHFPRHWRISDQVFRLAEIA